MDEGYFTWLKSNVEYFTEAGRHDHLFEVLHSLPFQPAIERDRNRVADAMALRDEYYGEGAWDGVTVETACSFLEFLVALARRMNYIYATVVEDRTQDMFWEVLHNLGLDEVTDDICDEDDTYETDKMIEYVVDTVNTRQFNSDGTEGLFPMPDTRVDQRNVEIWYQMNQYLMQKMTEEGRL